jgi:hypothetical protein
MNGEQVKPRVRNLYDFPIEQLNQALLEVETGCVTGERPKIAVALRRALLAFQLLALLIQEFLVPAAEVLRCARLRRPRLTHRQFSRYAWLLDELETYLGDMQEGAWPENQARLSAACQKARDALDSLQGVIHTHLPG